MRAAIDILMKEHRFIEEVAGSLETLLGQVMEGLVPERHVIAKYATFLKDFVDRTHHGKEENRLFARMIEHGFPAEHGPIGVMMADHVEGRGHTRTLVNLGAAEGVMNRTDLERLRVSAGSYVPLIRSHIGKEDNILYPMAMRVLPVPVLDQLEKEFFEFDQNQIGPERLNEYNSIGRDLTAQFPPDPKSVHPVFMSCHG
jgi:hemerythrin-like domain-containing protein